MTILSGLDSATIPNDDQLHQAKAAGYGMWAGYFAGPNIANGWGDDDFARVRAAGLETIAYCSGFSDPYGVSSRAKRLGIPICLDVEHTIRDDGPWVEAWVNAAGSGLYGNYTVFRNHPGLGAFCIDSGGPYWTTGGGPKQTWPSDLTHPAVPTGWQQQGTHSLFGLGVDAGYYDSAIWGTAPVEDDMTPQLAACLVKNAYVLGAICRAAKEGAGVAGSLVWADQTDQAGFANNVNAIVNGGDPHAICNAIIASVSDGLTKDVTTGPWGGSGGAVGKHTHTVSIGITGTGTATTSQNS